MTFKLTTTKLLKAFTVALCALAVAFAVAFIPRGAASADEPVADDAYAVTWEYQDDLNTWNTFVNGRTLFTYEEGRNYSGSVRAKIEKGGDTEYVYNSDGSAHLTYSGKFEGEDVTALVNAATYTVAIEGVDYIAAADTTITLKIAPRVFELRESDLLDYYGVGESNRLWLLQLENGTAELGDLTTYYDPDAEFSNEYGAKVTMGVLYNAYARYTGDEQTIVLNEDYEVNDKTLKDYQSAIKKIKYTNSTEDAEDTAGEENKVTKIVTTAEIELSDNWTLNNGGINTITLTKDWYIVTINNAFRTLAGDVNTSVASWTFGSEVPQVSIRPEHGDNVVFTLAKGESRLARFAVKYEGQGDETVLEYYDVKLDDNEYVIDTDKKLADDYCSKLLDSLKVGAYTLNVTVPAYISTEEHQHWWNDAEPETANVVYYPISRTYHFSVACYDVSADAVSMSEADDKDITIKLVTDRVAYNALENNTPDMVVTFRGELLTEGVDYVIESDNVNVGAASFMFKGMGSFNGTVSFDNVYHIDPAVNMWKDVPSIMYWTYGSYDKQLNLITAEPAYLDNKNDLWFKITTDKLGDIPAGTPLREFRLEDGLVPDDVAESLSSLPVGTYYLFATVKASTNYQALAPRGIAFKVFKATNRWEISPTITSWTEGKFGSINMPVAKALYGTPTIVIKDSNGKEVYNPVTGVNKLSSAKAGMYTLTAKVLATNDYDGVEYSIVFSVHEKSGIPVWVTVLIVLGALLLAAIIILILIKTGILRILTSKLMVNIRTQAAVDATVAAVRANKKHEEAKRYVAEFKQKEEAEAKKQEQKEARKAKAENEKALPVDQKIAALEEKARKASARADKMKARADAIQQRADRMKEDAWGAEQPEPEPEDEPIEQPMPESSTEPATENAAEYTEAAATEDETSTEE